MMIGSMIAACTALICLAYFDVSLSSLYAVMGLLIASWIFFLASKGDRR